MAEAQLEQSCSICSEKFSSERPAITLPCEEHSFCKMCICRIEMGVDRRCPNCRITWTHDIIEPSYSALAKIAFNNTKADLSFKQKNEKEVLCRDHDLKARFFCNDCEDILCDDCVTSSHRMHDFHTISNSAEKIREVLNTRLTDTGCKVSENLRSHKLKLNEVKQVKKALAIMDKEIVKVKELLAARKISSNTAQYESWEIIDKLHSVKTEMNNLKNDENLTEMLKTEEYLNAKVKSNVMPNEEKSEIIGKFVLFFKVSN